MLTHQQKRCLDFLKGHSGPPPTYREIAKALNLKGISGIHRLIHGLQERGHIRQCPYRARSVEIVDKSERKPVVVYTNAVYYRWDDGAQELVEWKP